MVAAGFGVSVRIAREWMSRFSATSGKDRGKCFIWYGMSGFFMPLTKKKQ